MEEWMKAIFDKTKAHGMNLVDYLSMAYSDEELATLQTKVRSEMASLQQSRAAGPAVQPGSELRFEHD